MEYEFIVTKVRRAGLILPIFPIIIEEKDNIIIYIIWFLWPLKFNHGQLFKNILVMKTLFTF